jgi:RNA polymerase sigma-70 factor (ECF subfamily)
VTVARLELDEVSDALASLTDDQRESIELRFFAGLSAREAAEVMGKQEGTVRGLQFRAIAALRRQLGIDDEVQVDRADRPIRRRGAR